MSKRRGLGRFLESVTGRIAGVGDPRGDVAAAVLRAAAGALVEGPAGSTAPNLYVVAAEFPDPADRETARWELADLVAATAVHRGWRLDGPVQVTFAVEVDPERLEVQTAFEEGDLPPWAWLSDAGGSTRLPVAPTRVLVGRAKDGDVVIVHPSISRRHALLWREAGGHWIADLTSSNGTFVDGEAVFDVVGVAHGSLIRFGEAEYTLELA